MGGCDRRYATCSDEEILDEVLAEGVDPDVQALYGNAFVQEQVSGGGVEFCSRVADIPIGRDIGLEHWWLRTANHEAGMGPDGGGVPGHGGGADSPYVTDTEIRDHTGQGDLPDATCVPVAEEFWPVDGACVDGMLEEGRDTGKWSLWNQCHTVVSDILEACRVRPDGPAEITDPDPYYRSTGQTGAGGAGP